MMIRFPRPQLVLAVLLAVIVTTMPLRHAGAQTTPSKGHVVDVDASNYPEVALTVDVPGATLEGSPAVTVVENGRSHPAVVAGAGAGHLEVVLVMDTSGSMAGPPLQAAKDAAAAFVDELPPGASAAIVGFGAHPYVVAPLTSDHGALKSAIGQLQADGETALYDALSVAADQFSPAPGPRSLVLVSDGGDTASLTPLNAVTDKLVASRSRLFGVQLVTKEANRPVLDGLSAATKGRTVEASDAAALAATYHVIAGEALHQLRVTYRSSAHGATSLQVVIGGAPVADAMPGSIDLPAAPTTVPQPVHPKARVEAPAAHGRDRTALALGGGAIFLALLLAAGGVLGRPRRSLLARERPSNRGAALHEVKQRAAAIMEHRLERKGRRDALGARLENAGLSLRPGEYVVAVSVAGAIGAVLGLMLAGVVLAVVFALIVVVVARALLTSRTNRRRTRLEKQLPDLLQQLTSSLRAGYGVMQAIDAVSRELDAPMSEELHRLVAEVQLGRELSDSMRAMAGRMGGRDFDWVVQAIEINREVGGDLVEVLEAVAETIRAREQLRRQVKTLSAQGRLSARILIAMPFVMAGVLSVMSPDYLAPFGQHAAGPVLLALGAVLLAVGWLWLRRIVRLEF